MAEVFIGSTMGAEGFSRRVAIKRVLPGYSDNPAFARMFVDEAQISSRMVHPNIVSVLDFDRDVENRLFLVMELVEGKDLDSLVSSGLLPFPVVIFVISEMLRGLGYAHDLPVGTDVRGIVHRDVSPHNVLLSWEGAVKVSDFGIAKARAASEATASVFIKGKPAYMSPEQANGQALDGRSDLFAVGIMLWEMLVGRRLFVGEDTRATLAAVLFGQIPRPRSLRGDVPKDLERVTMKLLERELPARYATAEKAVEDLLDCADAPKAGRDVLMRTLAERFPNDVRLRQSMLRDRIPTPPPIHAAATVLGPHASGSVQPSVPMGTPIAVPPAMATPMATPAPLTMTPPRQRKTGLIIALALMVAVGGITFGVIWSMRGGDKLSQPGSASGSAPVVASATPDAAAVAPPTIDAVVAHAIDPAPEPIDAAPPIDAAAPPDAPKKDARFGQSGHPVPERKPKGMLHVSALPVLTVWVDDKQIRSTPLDLDLTVGHHKIRLTNDELGHDETVHVNIVEGKTTNIDRSNWKN
jgi:Protein kinase domain